jgi:hypothetical protein
MPGPGLLVGGGGGGGSPGPGLFVGGGGCGGFVSDMIPPVPCNATGEDRVANDLRKRNVLAPEGVCKEAGRKSFFFTHGVPVPIQIGSRVPPDKSFLVLFFKKERLPS